MPAPVGRLPGPWLDELFDAVLGGVVELVSARAEDLDAVVGHRVVRRRDHHAEVGVVGAGQVRHSGRGQHADAQRVDALAGHPGDHRRLQHLAAGPRIAAHHGDAARMASDVAQPARRRRAQSQRQLSGQILIGDSAHPVGAEQSSHADKLLTDRPSKHNRRGHRRAAAESICQRDRKDSPPAPRRTRAVRYPEPNLPGGGRRSGTGARRRGCDAALSRGVLRSRRPAAGAASAARPF